MVTNEIMQEMFQEAIADPSHTLKIEYVTLDAQAIQSIVDFLNENKVISSLKLQSVRFSEENAGVVFLTKVLPKNVASLSLCSGEINPKVIEELAGVLSTNTTVTSLSLEDNDNIGLEGVKALIKALGTNTTLRSLNLQGTHLGSSGGGLEALKEIQTLLARNRGEDQKKVLEYMEQKFSAELKDAINVSATPMFQSFIDTLEQLESRMLGNDEKACLRDETSVDEITDFLLEYETPLKNLANYVTILENLVQKNRILSVKEHLNFLKAKMILEGIEAIEELYPTEEDTFVTPPLDDVIESMQTCGFYQSIHESRASLVVLSIGSSEPGTAQQCPLFVKNLYEKYGINADVFNIDPRYESTFYWNVKAVPDGLRVFYNGSQFPISYEWSRMHSKFLKEAFTMTIEAILANPKRKLIVLYCINPILLPILFEMGQKYSNSLGLQLEIMSAFGDLPIIYSSGSFKDKNYKCFESRMSPFWTQVYSQRGSNNLKEIENCYSHDSFGVVYQHLELLSENYLFKKDELTLKEHRDKAQKDFFDIVRMISIDKEFSDANYWLNVYKGGVNINAFSETDQTALMIAAEAGDEKLIQALLDRNADIGLQNGAGLLAFNFAHLKGCSKTILDSLQPSLDQSLKSKTRKMGN